MAEHPPGVAAQVRARAAEVAPAPAVVAGVPAPAVVAAVAAETPGA